MFKCCPYAPCKGKGYCNVYVILFSANSHLIYTYEGTLVYSKKSTHYTGGLFCQGKVNKELFFILIDISSIRSEKVINALTDFFVYGCSRNTVCEKYNVNQGYLSIKIKELQLLGRKIKDVIPYYLS